MGKQGKEEIFKENQQKRKLANTLYFYQLKRVVEVEWLLSADSWVLFNQKWDHGKNKSYSRSLLKIANIRCCKRVLLELWKCDEQIKIIDLRKGAIDSNKIE